MKYIDGVLAPCTIRTGIYINDGRAYFILGNFVTVLTPGIIADIYGAERWMQ